MAQRTRIGFNLGEANYLPKAFDDQEFAARLASGEDDHTATGFPPERPELVRPTTAVLGALATRN